VADSPGETSFWFDSEQRGEKGWLATNISLSAEFVLSNILYSGECCKECQIHLALWFSTLVFCNLALDLYIFFLVLS